MNQTIKYVDLHRDKEIDIASDLLLEIKLGSILHQYFNRNALVAEIVDYHCYNAIASMVGEIICLAVQGTPRILIDGDPTIYHKLVVLQLGSNSLTVVEEIVLPFPDRIISFYDSRSSNYSIYALTSTSLFCFQSNYLIGHGYMNIRINQAFDRLCKEVLGSAGGGSAGDDEEAIHALHSLWSNLIVYAASAGLLDITNQLHDHMLIDSQSTLTNNQLSSTDQLLRELLIVMIDEFLDEPSRPSPSAVLSKVASSRSIDSIASDIIYQVLQEKSIEATSCTPVADLFTLAYLISLLHSSAASSSHSEDLIFTNDISGAIHLLDMKLLLSIAVSCRHYVERTMKILISICIQVSSSLTKDY
jgi:hypothetical protein